MLRAEILARCSLFGGRATAAFHQWTYQPEWELHAQNANMLRIADRWQWWVLLTIFLYHY